MNQTPFQDKSPKQKLTLTVSKDVIVKAREAGVNISDITEKLLTVITFETKDGYTIPAVQAAYEAVFLQMTDLAHLYGAKIFEVGIHQKVIDREGRQRSDVPIFFDESIRFYVWDSDVPIQYEFDDIYIYLHPVMQILENFFRVLTVAAEENKDQISELRFALKLVETLSQDKTSRNE